ncbi:hypothetical protein [Haloarchaeobius sp. HME9146]|uniref:DUF5789 family protein n=1 Tax=Haloarchaeobius sp. HME9146 TaxID=2978732 RepID=UPI0034E982F6
MSNNKRGRYENAGNDPRKRPERAEEKVRDRAHEARAMDGDPGGRLGALDEALETHSYPTTTNELVEAYGDYEIETQGGSESLEDVLSRTENQTYDSADDVRSRVLGLVHR